MNAVAKALIEAERRAYSRDLLRLPQLLLPGDRHLLDELLGLVQFLLQLWCLQGLMGKSGKKKEKEKKKEN